MKNSNIKLSLIFISILSGSDFFYANAASFNCDKAKTPTEIRVCANDDLSKLDEDLSERYKTAMKTTKNKAELKKTEITWIKSLNDCNSVDCLKEKYNTRINDLNSPDITSSAERGTAKGDEAEVKNPVIKSVPDIGANYYCYGTIKSEVYNTEIPNNPYHNVESHPNDRDPHSDTFSFFKDKMIRVIEPDKRFTNVPGLTDHCQYFFEKQGVVTCKAEDVGDKQTRYSFDKNLPTNMSITLISSSQTYHNTTEFTDCRREQ